MQHGVRLSFQFLRGNGRYPAPILYGLHLEWYSNVMAYVDYEFSSQYEFELHQKKACPINEQAFNF